MKTETDTKKSLYEISEYKGKQCFEILYYDLNKLVNPKENEEFIREMEELHFSYRVSLAKFTQAFRITFNNVDYNTLINIFKYLEYKYPTVFAVCSHAY